MPKGVYDSLKFYADTWAEHGVSSWGKGWFELPQVVGNKIAPVMGAAPDSVLIHQNASVFAVVDTMEEILSYGSWKQHAKSREFVT